MGTAETQIAQVTKWFSDSSQSWTTYFGDLVIRGNWAVLHRLGLDEAPRPNLAPYIAGGALVIYSPQADGPGDLTAPPNQPTAVERVLHLIWASGAAKADSALRVPPVAVVGLSSASQTIRQAMTAAGLPVGTDRAVLAVPVYAFEPAERVRMLARLPVR